MAGFKIPRVMPVFTIWMLWGCFTVVPILWLLVGATRYWGVSGEPWAAWVQAIGSIGAIVGAFLIAQHTHRLERNAKAEETIQLEIDALHFAENAAYEAYSSVNQVAGFAVSAPYMIGLGRLEEVRYTLRSLLSRPLPAEVFGAIFVVQEQVSEALNAAERVKKDINLPGYMRQGDAQELEHRRQVLSEARKIIAGLYWNKAALAGIPYDRRPEDQERVSGTNIDSH